MKSLKKYVWIFEWIGTAFLISLAIVTVVKSVLLYYAIGLIFLIFGLLRVVPLIKTTDSKMIRWFIAVETIVDVLAGLLLLFWAIKEKTDQGSIVGYVIGGVLYLRGFMHFLATSVKNEPTDFVSFLTNICLITIATVIITKGNFNSNTLKWIFFIMIFIVAVIFALRGLKDYRSYRGELVGNSRIKRARNQTTDTDETNPTSDEIRINIDNTNVDIDNNDNTDRDTTNV